MRSAKKRTILDAEVDQQIRYRIANSRVLPYPFPHFFVENIFPARFYDALMDHLPPQETYRPITEVGRISSGQRELAEIYKERVSISLNPDIVEVLHEKDRKFWAVLIDWLFSESFKMFVLGKFDAQLRQRYGTGLGKLLFHSQAQLLRDATNYSLGPHADHPSKAVVLLFYLPKSDRDSHLGTSIYVSRRPEEHQDTGRHYPREQFTQAATMPYIPNALFGFFKTPRSFHGVEPITDSGIRRDILQFSIETSRSAA